ncbi:MAG: hypothetical protein WA432_03455 [Candidatus Babeliaceae bacterium]
MNLKQFKITVCILLGLVLCVDISARNTLTLEEQKRIAAVSQRIKDVFIKGPQKSFAEYADDLTQELTGIQLYEKFCKDLKIVKHYKTRWQISLFLLPYYFLIPADLHEFLSKIPKRKRIAIFEEMLHFNEK